MGHRADTNVFKETFYKNLMSMIHTDVAVNNGQLHSFYTYFLSKYPEKYPETEWAQKIEEPDLQSVLRLLMVYSTLALTVHDDEIYDAAVEVCPMSIIPMKYVGFAKDILDHIEKNPADDTRKIYIQGLGSRQFPLRMNFLAKSLNNVLVGVI